MFDHRLDTANFTRAELHRSLMLMSWPSACQSRSFSTADWPDFDSKSGQMVMWYYRIQGHDLHTLTVLMWGRNFPIVNQIDPQSNQQWLIWLQSSFQPLTVSLIHVTRLVSAVVSYASSSAINDKHEKIVVLWAAADSTASKHGRIFIIIVQVADIQSGANFFCPFYQIILIREIGVRRMT